MCNNLITLIKLLTEMPRVQDKGRTRSTQRIRSVSPEKRMKMEAEKGIGSGHDYPVILIINQLEGTPIFFAASSAVVLREREIMSI